MKKVLVSNIMMLKEKDRFDKAIRDLEYDPVWAAPDQFLSEQECLDLVGEIDGWLAGDDRITASVLEAALPRLKVIAKWGTGIDSIDLEAAKRLGVEVKNSPAAFANAVAEVAIHYMLSLSRNLVEIDRAVRTGAWPKPQGIELTGRTLGMIGFGAIGQRIAELTTAFGMDVIFFDPFQKDAKQLLGKDAHPVSLDEIAERADIICLACSYNTDNHHIVNDEFLHKVRPSTMIVNVARGPLVDQAALVSALKGKRIAGAGLDVFETEPLDKNDALTTFENVVLGSHNANNGRAAVEYVHQNTLNNLHKVLG
ncbi:phosphoglycerate dehydrogenase [uncultured Roseibium sp.]|uniref:phosphoglycerate dehydrogenase n=1 Tax=uncultured Roseibium sp. TaxID=1936171 RepID=UPI0026308014|nr:phosphoglycerate dehydrogenase [uncultured Roseibium sp.]